MRKVGLAAAALLVVLFVTTSVHAASCTKEDLVKAVENAAALINAKGRAALPELKQSRFCGEDGYFFVVQMNGINVMHPIQKLEGKDMSMLQGAKGEFFGAEMKARAEKDGAGWVSYTWENPKTKKVEVKCTYIKTATMDGVKVFVGSGIFGITCK